TINTINTINTIHTIDPLHDGESGAPLDEWRQCSQTALWPVRFLQETHSLYSPALPGRTGQVTIQKDNFLG
ncbi:MAG TPA: hypothetical protein VF780_09550, partial [Nitrosospira sp.]